MPSPPRLPVITPMLAAAARALPDNEDDWAAEIKWDGARAIASIAGEKAVIRSRSGRDVTSAFPEVAAGLIAAAGGRSLILDGELTAFAGTRPSFALLQRRLHLKRPTADLVAAVPVTLVVFDLLYQSGRPLLRDPYTERRALLDGLEVKAREVIVPPAFPGQVHDVAEASRQLGLEGVVLKRLGSYYYPGRRSADWQKVKHLLASDVTIGGWLPGAGHQSSVAGSVLVGSPGPEGLEYAGQVGSGFTELELRVLTGAMREIEQADSPFSGSLPRDVARHAHWTVPVFVAEVSYTERTAAGRLRHPVWRGLRAALR